MQKKITSNMTPPSTSHVARVRAEELVMEDITTGLLGQLTQTVPVRSS